MNSGPEILKRIRDESFEPLGWFVPSPEDRVPDPIPGKPARFCLLVGNAGPGMFARFENEREPAKDKMDDWTKAVLTPVADTLGAHVVFPFERPFHPFLTWARRGGGGHVSPLGMNIHPRFGLWHAYRAAFIFPNRVELEAPEQQPHPCESCVEKPCLTACPISAFSKHGHDVDSCRDYVASPNGHDCATEGCKPRLACPIGAKYRYVRTQIEFHMRAFATIR